MKVMTLISAAAVLAAAAPAVAQQQQPQQQPRGYDSPAPHNSMGPGVQQSYFDFQSRLAQQGLTAQAIRKKEPRERIERAERIGALIDAGQCPQAEQVASSEGDEPMAIRVRQVCVAKMKKLNGE